MKLIIKTMFPIEVMIIISQLELVEVRNMEPGEGELIIRYPDDTLSQAFGFWLVMAKGCQFISDYQEGK